MYVRHLFAAAAAGPSFYAVSAGRLGAIVAAVLGLIGIVLGELALARSRRTGRLTA